MRLEDIISQINELQTQNAHWLGTNVLSALPFETQISYCRNNKTIGELAFQAYLILKNGNKPNEAAFYFSLSFRLNDHQSEVEISNAIKNGAEEKHKEIIPLDSGSEDLFTRGFRYLLGIGNQQNRAKALPYLEEAANQGHLIAQHCLVIIYNFNNGVWQYTKEAFKWNRLAAEQGFAPTQNYVGRMYETGEGFGKDIKKAVKWYRLGAEQGYAKAQSNLGRMYQYGNGVGQDTKEAYKWYRLAAEQGYAKAQFNLGFKYLYGNGVEQDIKEGIKWYRLAAEQGFAQAQYFLGCKYATGNGVELDIKEAVKWFRLAAEQSHAKAIEKLTDIQKSHPEAEYHFAMMEADASKLERLLAQDIYLLDEIIWDVKRSAENESLSNILSSVINHLLDKCQWLKSSNKEAAKLTLHFLLFLSQTLQLKQEHVSILNKIPFSNMNKETCREVLLLVIDLLFSEKMNAKTAINHELTWQAAQFISNTVLHLASIKEKIEDSSVLRLCALILIQNQFGNKYEVSLTETISFNDLVLFSAFFRTSTSPEKINMVLEKQIIKQVVFTDHEDLLDELLAHLEHHEASQNVPELLALKNRLIDQWKSPVNSKATQSITLLADLCQAAKGILELNSKKRNCLFSTENVHAQRLFNLLACQDFKGLRELLYDNLQVMTVNTLAT